MIYATRYFKFIVKNSLRVIIARAFLNGVNKAEIVKYLVGSLMRRFPPKGDPKLLEMLTVLGKDCIRTGSVDNEWTNGTIYLFECAYILNKEKSTLTSSDSISHSLLHEKEKLRNIYNHGNSFELKVPWEFGRGGWVVQKLLYIDARNYKSNHLLREEIYNDIDYWIRISSTPNSVYDYPMENAIRVINAMIIYESLPSDSVEARRIRDSLYKVICSLVPRVILQTELSQNPGNHFFTQILAIHLLGRYYKLEIFNYIYQVMCKLAKSDIYGQFLNDGGGIEGSVGYSNYMLELLLVELFLKSDDAGEINHLSTEHKTKLRKIIHFYTNYSRALANNLGDCDNSYIMPMRLNASKKAIDVILEHFNMTQCAETCPSTEPYKIITADEFGLAKILFQRDDLAVYVRLFSSSFYGTGGHARDDAFSIWVTIGGKMHIGSLGTPCYTGNLELLKSYKRATSHSTLRLSNHECSTVESAWRLNYKTIFNFHSYKSNSSNNAIKVEHIGVEGDWKLSRSITIGETHGEYVLYLVDQSSCESEDLLESRIHMLQSDRIIQYSDCRSVINYGSDIKIRLNNCLTTLSGDSVAYTAFNNGSPINSVIITACSKKKSKSNKIEWSIHFEK